jgi:tetratricopeptide (TPR) repeat protein
MLDDWVLAQINLAATLYTLWQRTHDVRHARRAVHCCVEARKRTRAPLRWASASNNAAIMMHAVSEHLSGEERRNLLVDSFDMFREALCVRTRDRLPLLWAESMTGLACVQLKLGKLDKDAVRVNQGIEILTLLLGEYRCERAPAEWAMTQLRIGGAYQLLDEIEGKTHRLQEALACYRQILTLLTPEGAPLLWATATGNLGVVLHRLGEHEEGTMLLEEAQSAYEAALPIFVRHQSECMQTCQEKLSALRDLLERRGKPERVESDLRVISTSHGERRRTVARIAP